MSITRAQVDRDEVSWTTPPTIWRTYTVARMREQRPGADRRYEVVKTYNPNGFFHSNKHYAQVWPDGTLKLMTEFEARQAHGEDTALYGYVECDAAWRAL